MVGRLVEEEGGGASVWGGASWVSGYVEINVLGWGERAGLRFNVRRCGFALAAPEAAVRRKGTLLMTSPTVMC